MRAKLLIVVDKSPDGRDKAAAALKKAEEISK